MEATAKNDISNRTNIRVGDRVLVYHGSLTGVVRYVGDLDSQYTNAKLYIGIKLDAPCELKLYYYTALLTFMAL